MAGREAMKTSEKELLALAETLGFDQAALVDTENIVFEPSFRRFCEANLCGKYGANYTCPPDCGSAEEMRSRIRAYRKALVLQSRWEIDGRDEEAVKPAKADHNRRTRTLMERGELEGLMVGASGCNLCAPCLRVQGEPCRFPALRFSCMSAYCVHVAGLAGLCGMDYYSEGTVRLFSMCCFDRRDG